MAGTYCDKLCEECTRREDMACPGCKAGPGSSWFQGCEIAACCREKGHDTCKTCSFASSCNKLRHREDMPEIRRRSQAERAAVQAEMNRKIPFLARWLGILFWLIVPSVLADLMNTGLATAWFPALPFWGGVLGGACQLAYGLILLKLSEQEEQYRTAGICCLITSIANLILSGIFGAHLPGWTLLITLPLAVVGLVSEYEEMRGHAEILYDLRRAETGSQALFQQAMSPEKWEKLWKWYLRCMVATLGGAFLMLIFLSLGGLLTVAGAIGMVVVGIVKLVYLYRTYQVFRSLSRSGDARASF